MKGKILLAIMASGLFFGTSSASTDNFNHYVKSEWSSGYCYRFEIDNISEDYYNNWNVSFDVNSPIRSTYSAVFSQDGNSYNVV
jgi:cellulase/cellobiase CelA1